LVLLAGEPEIDDFGRQRVHLATNDPAGLRLASDRDPDAVVGVIRKLLRRRPTPSSLVLPPGLVPDRPIEPPSDRERCAAAAAVRLLAATHADLAWALAPDLSFNLADRDPDSYSFHRWLTCSALWRSC
jgi:hypothetical protein